MFSFRTGCAILCLSQLNRTSDESVRPSPSELRDSGSIEQDANKVILMWCIEKNLNERGFVESKTIGVDVTLNRRGTTGVTLFNFNGNYMQFTELDRKYEEARHRTIGTLNFIKLRLQDVLFNPVTKEVYTPNTNQITNIENKNGGLKNEQFNSI